MVISVNAAYLFLKLSRLNATIMNLTMYFSMLTPNYKFEKEQKTEPTNVGTNLVDLFLIFQNPVSYSAFEAES